MAEGKLTRIIIDDEIFVAEGKLTRIVNVNSLKKQVKQGKTLGKKLYEY